jgi:hypothetical protein
MKKLVVIGLAVVLAVTLGAGLGLAGDNIPSAKTAMYSGDVEWASASSVTEVLDPVQIKTGEPKDLVISVSAECVLLTNSKLTGKTSEDSGASIMVTVLVDGEEADPGQVTFASRTVRIKGDLTHPWAGEDCDADPTTEVQEPCEHWIMLFMDTKTANTFNFIAQDVGSGVHNIEVVAQLDAYGVDDPDTPASDYAAMIGKATVVVEEVDLK